MTQYEVIDGEHFNNYNNNFDNRLIYIYLFILKVLPGNNKLINLSITMSTSYIECIIPFIQLHI